MEWVESTIILSQLTGWWIYWRSLTDKMDRSYQFWPMKWVQSTHLWVNFITAWWICWILLTYWMGWIYYFTELTQLTGGGSVGYFWPMKWVESTILMSQVTGWWICWKCLTYEMGWIGHFTESAYWGWIYSFDPEMGWIYHFNVSSYWVVDLWETFDLWKWVEFLLHQVNSTYWEVDLLDTSNLWSGLNLP